MTRGEAPIFLNYEQAAERVKRSPRSIRLWRRQGMPMSWRTTVDGQRERVVQLDVLLSWWRDRMKADPVHHNRMRAIAKANGRPTPAAYASPARQKPVALPVDAGEPVTAGARPTAPDAPDPKPFEPLDTMKPLRGGPEYRVLQEQLSEIRPPCAGDDRYTADRIDDATAAQLADLCQGCPALEACAAFAVVGRPAAGYWPTGAVSASAAS